MIVSFSSNSEREAFLDVIRRDRGDLLPLCRRATVLPHLTFRGLDAEQAHWLQRHAAPGKVHEDVKFQTFAS